VNAELITTKEAAERLGWTVFQVHYRAERKGLKPAAQAPGTRGAKFWLASDIAALEASDEAA
jgi:hypothetical protein